MILSSRELMPIIRSSLERGQRVRMTVSGRSMVPFIWDGDVVELEPVRLMPSLGDTLLVHYPATDRYVVHRVVRVKGDAFFLRGDAQKYREGPFTRRDVLGQVVALHRNGRNRPMNRGRWRFAGVAWTRLGPLVYWLLWLAVRIRAGGRSALRRLQRDSMLRVAKRSCYAFRVRLTIMAQRMRNRKRME